MERITYMLSHGDPAVFVEMDESKYRDPDKIRFDEHSGKPDGTKTLVASPRSGGRKQERDS